MKIARLFSGKDEEEGGKGRADGGCEGGSQRACKREQRRRQQEDRAYREVNTYDYEQHG